jgi:hypothetical protein
MRVFELQVRRRYGPLNTDFAMPSWSRFNYSTISACPTYATPMFGLSPSPSLSAFCRRPFGRWTFAVSLESIVSRSLIPRCREMKASWLVRRRRRRQVPLKINKSILRPAAAAAAARCGCCTARADRPDNCTTLRSPMSLCRPHSKHCCNLESVDREAGKLSAGWRRQ